jgi:nucleosome binding factor SPN SPT16 subunit
MSARVNKDRFLKRMGKIYESWNNQNEEILSNINSMLFVTGNLDEENVYNKTNAMQSWLYNTHLVDTVLVLTKNHIYFLGSQKKVQFVENLKSNDFNGSVPPITLLQREKSDKDRGNMDKLRKILEEAGENVGYFAKEKPNTEFTKSIMEGLPGKDYKPNLTDITLPFAILFAVKLPDEIEIMKKSCTASVNAWKFMKSKLVNATDLKKKVRHNKFADDIEKEMVEVKQQGDMSGHVEACYTPIVQSGGKYVLKFSAQSPDTAMDYGCVVGTVGCRYRSYCSNVGRTMLLEPSDELEKQYETAMAMETAIIEALKPGAVLKDVYEAGINFLKSKDVKLADKLTQAPFGFATGLEFREGQLVIGPKSTAVVKENMTFVIAIGFNNLVNKAAKEGSSQGAAIFISDTVLVVKDGAAENLTAGAKNRVKSFVIRLKDEPAAPVDDIISEGRKKRNVILEDQTRHKQTNEDKRKKKQSEIGQRLNEEAKARLAGTQSGDQAVVSKKSTVAYKNREKMPDELEITKLMVYVDRRNDSVVVPVYGVSVPFHISMIKNCSHSVEGDYVYLRINFAHPGSQIGRDNQNFQNPLATFIKELTFRSSNVKEPGELQPSSDNLLTAMRLIKDLQKKYRTQEAEEKEKEGAVKQDKLKLNPPGAKMAPRLKDLFVRPNIVAKRLSGTLEAHINGFRYHSVRGDDIDVLYNNIKHAFFQPCDNEMIILLHFHLKNPVLWGKKKYQDIQFFTEVGEITTDLGKYHHMQDRDDMQSEQQEREMRKKLNAAFQSFADKVSRQTNEAVDFDQPFNQLAFTGVPYRSACTLKPTSSCLVNLTEWPPLVITLDEVELVSFERVSFQIRNFDMVFIFKDYSRKVQTINSIPATSLDSIKDWLNSCDIRYFEGIQSLNWNNIMRTITKDPEAFFEDGGWNFLNSNSDEEAVDDESSEDAYSPSEDSASGEDDDDDDDESAADSEEDDDSASEGSLDSDESSGKSWSDLEEEAARADRNKEMGEETRSTKHSSSNRFGGSSSNRHGGGSSSNRPGGSSSNRHSGGSSSNRHGGSSSANKRPNGFKGGPPPKRRK